MKYIKCLILAVVLFGAVSCSVDRVPETQLSDATFWLSENDLNSAANYLYTFLPSIPLYEDNMSIDGFAVEPNSISNGTRTVPNWDDYYTNSYKLIRAACNIIAKAPKAVSAGIDPGIVNKYVAEAKFFRAWAYYNLVKRYGDVILVTTPLASDAKELTAARTNREIVYDTIYADLDFAAANLQLPTVMGAANYGRISRTAVWAVESRAALFAGTWNKFHNMGEWRKHLERSKNAADKIIQSGEHSLYTGGYFNLYQYQAEGMNNKENVMVRRYGSNDADIISYHNVPMAMVSGGVINPTKYLVDAYLMKDGLPINKSPLYKTPDSIIQVFDNRDKRLSETVMKRGDNFSLTAKFVVSTHSTGYTYRKFVIQEDMGKSRSYIDYTIIRYAEVLLNYAEAKYELDGGISDADLNRTINLLRDRGEVAHLTNAFATANALNLREEIRRERRVELSMEGFRYWDLLRWKTSECELPRPVLGAYFFKEEYLALGYAWNPNVNAGNFIMPESGDMRTFIPQRDYLWPLPLTELSMNPNLVQNPNWN